MKVERRLAAILDADVVGYTRLMGADEAGTLRRLTVLSPGETRTLAECRKTRNFGGLYRSSHQCKPSRILSAAIACLSARRLQPNP